MSVVRTNQSLAFGDFGCRQFKAFAFTERKSVRVPKLPLPGQRFASSFSSSLKNAGSLA